MRAILASTNPGKAREVAAVLSGSPLTVDGISMWIGSEEQAHSYLENARAKASAVMRLTGRTVLAEDSGIEIDALGGLPGPRSARFAGPAASDLTNNEKLLRALDGVPDAQRTARYRAVALLLFPSGREVIGEGVFEGSVAYEQRGTNGFGYDPLFIPAGHDRTCGELDPSSKDAMSHRGKALRALLASLGAG